MMEAGASVPTHAVALPRGWWFRMRFFFLLLSLGSLSMVAPGRCRETGCVHGGARLTERFLSPVPARPDSNQRVRISGLKNVA